MTTCGRCLQIQDSTLILLNSSGRKELKIENPAAIREGDWVEVTGARAKILTPNRKTSDRFKWLEHVQNPRRRAGVEMRSRVESGIRRFFLEQGFLETRTPLLVPCPGMETHIRPFRLERPPGVECFLPTSPEFAMKKLLVGGLEKIFQITSSFRDEPQSVTHFPEFTILEWYRAFAGYEDIMSDTERMFESLALQIFGSPSIQYQGRSISVKTPWPRLKVRDLFQEVTGIDLTKSVTAEALAQDCARLGLEADLARENWDDLYFKIWLNLIEPKLPQDLAVFVTRYPASQAALSVIDQDPDGSRWAKRFEVYAGGLELGNAFEELTDPQEQRARFVKDMKLRTEIYGADFPPNPMDEEFLDALTEGMPPSGGIAMGVDRIVMLFANESDIRYTSWLAPFA